MDFGKLILTLLPYSLRRVTLVSLLKIFVGPVIYLYNLFNLFKNEKIIDQAGTNQVIYLIRLASSKIGLDIHITEDTGLPNDFIVNCETLDVDRERKLVELINRYKQAGKSFTINNSAVVFSQLWGGYVCETESVTQSWGGYVCEKILLPINDINITIRIVDINLTDTWITVEATLFPVSCQLNVIAEYEGSTYIKETIDYADTNPGHITYTVDRQAGETISTVEPAVYEDEFYRYVTHVTFIT